MNKEQYEILKEKFGHIASFTIWSSPIHGEKSNTSNLELLEKEDLNSYIQTSYVFVDYKSSTGYNQRRDGKNIAWMNFHSDKARQNDYKLRYALKDTPLWASYITPLCKEHSMEENLRILTEELSYFENPTLIALGGNVYKELRSHFQDQYKIIVIKHPSFEIKLDEYRQEIIEKASLEILD